MKLFQLQRISYAAFGFISSVVRVSALESVQSPLHGADAPATAAHRIAIIGAGAGGASAAFHISQFYNESDLDVPIKIDVFESNSYVGGRTTTVDALDDPRYPTELGASIFVTVNHVLYNLSRDFELSTRDRGSESTGAIYDLGIWDGSKFVFTLVNDDGDDGSWTGRWKSYWDIAKLFWKYGLSPLRTVRAKDRVVSSFLKMYDEYFPIASLTNFASAVGLSEYTGITGAAALLKDGVSLQFAREIVQSSTRVNYAQNLDSIHGLETMVCMATNGAMSIDGGNWQIFDRAIQHSGAALHLNTTVTEVSKTSAKTYQLKSVTATSPGNEIEDHTLTREYDTVVLAAPYQFSSITFTPPLSTSTIPQKIDYVTLYVTLFTSPYRPSPSYFGLSSQDQVPDSVLTTLPTDWDSDRHDGDSTKPVRGVGAVGPTKFWSLSTLRTLNPATDEFKADISDEELSRASKLPHNLDVDLNIDFEDADILTSKRSKVTTDLNQKQYLYKIFSPVPLTATFVSDLFAFNHSSSSSSPDTDPITKLPKSQVSWSYSKTWPHAYPYLPPKTKFSPIMLDNAVSPERLTTFNNEFTQISFSDATPADAFGLYYTSAVESFISTMETSALMGRNVAGIIVQGLSSLVEEKYRRILV